MCMANGSSAPMQKMDFFGSRNGPQVGGVNVADPLGIYGESDKSKRKQMKKNAAAEKAAFDEANGYRQEVVDRRGRLRGAVPASKSPGLGITTTPTTDKPSLLGAP